MYRLAVACYLFSMPTPDPTTLPPVYIIFVQREGMEKPMPCEWDDDAFRANVLMESLKDEDDTVDAFVAAYVPAVL